MYNTFRALPSRENHRTITSVTRLKTSHILWLIIILGFLVRILGIGFGLPLWLVGDEPPFVLSALQMIQLKTVVPALHEQTFAAISYFPPYLAYIYLPFFIILLGIKYLLFHGGPSQFILYLLSDLSHFFITGRIISVLFGTASIWFLWRATSNILKSERAALCAATFFAFSTLHVLLSHWGRDWVPAVFFFVLALWALTHSAWAEKKRYMVTAFIAGIAFGISVAAVFIPVFMALWIFVVEKKSLKEIISSKTMWAAALLFIMLALISIALFPAGFFFSGANSLSTPKTFARLIETYAAFLHPLLFVDPILTLWAIVGLVAAWIAVRKLFWVSILFTNIYILAYFFSFHTGDRFVLYLYPILALLAGYGLMKTYEYSAKINILVLVLGIVSLLAMIAGDFQLDRILLRNDTRFQTRVFVEKNIPSDSKIMVLAPLTRLATTPNAIAEQELIDSSSLRKIDQAERTLPRTLLSVPQFHALNLYTLNKNVDDFYNHIDSYIKTHEYQYAFISESSFGNSEIKNRARDILKSSGTILKKFPGTDPNTTDLTEGTIANIWSLFVMPANGPTVDLVKIK